MSRVADGEGKAGSGVAFRVPPCDHLFRVLYGRNEAGGKVEPAPVLRITVEGSQDGSVGAYEGTKNKTTAASAHHLNVGNGGAGAA